MSPTRYHYATLLNYSPPTLLLFISHCMPLREAGQGVSVVNGNIYGRVNTGVWRELIIIFAYISTSLSPEGPRYIFHHIVDVFELFRCVIRDLHLELLLHYHRQLNIVKLV